jgi:hypothetical protein
VDLDADDLPAHGELLREGRRGRAEYGQAQERRYCCFFHLFPVWELIILLFGLNSCEYTDLTAAISFWSVLTF